MVSIGIQDHWRPGRARSAGRANIALAALFLALVALHAIGIWRHLPWNDEYQAWLIARESSLATLLHNLRFEGHPALWYLVLMGAQRLWDDPAMLSVVQFVFAVASTGLLLAFAPMPPTLRALVACNYFLAFEYAVTARSYSIGVLLWVVTLVTWRRDWVWVALALMVHVSVHFAMLAGALALYRLATRGWNWPAVAALAASAALAAFCMWPDPATVTSAELDGQPMRQRIMWGLLSTGSTLLPVTPIGGWFFKPWTQEFKWAAVIAFVLLPLMLTGLFASDWLRRALVIAMVVAMFALTVLVHPAYVRHIGVVALLVIALAALGGTTAGRETTTFAAFNMIWAAQGLLAAGLALAGGGFAANTQAARWVVAEGLDGKRWVTESGIAADSLVVFTRQPVFNAKTGCWATFHRWNHSPSAFTSNERLMAGMQAAADTDGVVYVLVHGEPERAVPRDRLGLELIARFGPDNSAEVTWLYRAKVVPLGTSERKPLCP